MADCTTIEEPQAPAPPERLEGSVAHLWRVHADLMAISKDPSLSDDAWDDLTDQAGEVEKAVLKGPITDAADAIAKLEAVLPSFEEGERSDGADADALAAVIEWLKALRPTGTPPPIEAMNAASCTCFQLRCKLQSRASCTASSRQSSGVLHCPRCSKLA